MAGKPRLLARVDRPTCQHLKSSGMKIVESTGKTLAWRPSTFVLEIPVGYYASEIISDLNDDNEMLGWGAYRRATLRNPARVSRPPVPKPPGGVRSLPGPPPPPAERRVAGAKSTLKASGPHLFWGSITIWDVKGHLFKGRTSTSKNLDALPAQVKMVLVNMYGFKKRLISAAPEINDAIRDCRDVVTAAVAALRQAPAARGDAHPSGRLTARVSGDVEVSISDPVELADIDFAPEEDELRRAAQCAPSPFGSVVRLAEFPDVGNSPMEMVVN